MGLGCAHVGLGQHVKAVEAFDKGLLHDGENVQLILNKGMTLIQMGKENYAIDTFQSGIDIALRAKEVERYAQLCVYCGQLCEQKGDDHTALDYYAKVFKLYKHYSQVWYLMGCIHHRLGDKEQALFHLKQAVACDAVWPSAYYKLSKLTKDEKEKQRLYTLYLQTKNAMPPTQLE